MLKDFLDKYGRDTTTNFYLRDILKDLNLKRSIIMRNKIDECKTRQSPYKDKNNLIINLQTSNEKGSHWILASKKFKIYFDNYSVVPIKEIYENYFIDASWVYNTIQVQKIDTKICGQLYCFVLKELTEDKRFEDIVIDLHKTLVLNLFLKKEYNSYTF